MLAPAAQAENATPPVPRGFTTTVLFAVCLSGGAPLLNTVTARQLRQHLDGNGTPGPTNVFASLHHSGPTPATLIDGLRALSPAAYEIYSSGPFQCTPSLKCKTMPARGCTFLVQFEGVRRAFRLMVAFEEQYNVRHAFVVRHRFDLLTNFRSAVPASYDFARAWITPAFIGCRRPSDQEVSTFDFDDKGWVCGRMCHNHAQDLAQLHVADPPPLRPIPRTPLHTCVSSVCLYACTMRARVHAHASHAIEATSGSCFCATPG